MKTAREAVHEVFPAVGFVCDHAAAHTAECDTLEEMVRSARGEMLHYAKQAADRVEFQDALRRIESRNIDHAPTCGDHAGPPDQCKCCEGLRAQLLANTSWPLPER